MKTFQQPLSTLEESKCLEELNRDDITRAKEAKRILIERNMRLVAHIARKYQNQEDDMEDLISVGTIGLIKAIDSYDARKGCKLVTYASRCIDNELLMLMRGKRKTAREVSLFEPIGTDKEGNEITLLDICTQNHEDYSDSMERKNQLRIMTQVVNSSLNEREKRILIMRFGLNGTDELTQREVGKILGISRSYVSRIEKRALDKLRESMKR